VPVADVPALLQALASSGTGGASDSTGLYESVRMALARGIVASLLPQPGAPLPVLALDADFEARLRAVLTVRPDGPVLALPPAPAEATQAAVVRAFEAQAQRDVTVLLLPADLRRACGRLFRGVLPRVAFVSRDEAARSGVALDVVDTLKTPAELTTP
jgi:flagellar biosynthesis component FlhA